MLAKFSGVESKGPYLSLEKKRKNVLCSLTQYSGRVKLGSFKFQSWNDG